MTPDELWEKYNGHLMLKSEFLAALAEYGAAVRKRDVEICREESADGASDVCDLCAAAIAREPLL